MNSLSLGLNHAIFFPSTMKVSLMQVKERTCNKPSTFLQITYKLQHVCDRISSMYPRTPSVNSNFLYNLTDKRPYILPLCRSRQTVFLTTHNSLFFLRGEASFRFESIALTPLMVFSGTRTANQVLIVSRRMIK